MNATQDTKTDKSPEEWIRWLALIPALVLIRILVGLYYDSSLTEGQLRISVASDVIFSFDSGLIALAGGIFQIWASRRLIPQRKMIVTLVALALILIFETRSMMIKELMCYCICEFCVIAGAIIGALIAIFKRTEPIVRQ
jgi:hypothetical protein